MAIDSMGISRESLEGPSNIQRRNPDEWVDWEFKAVGRRYTAGIRRSSEIQQ